MKRNWDATTKHSHNLTTAIEMLRIIAEKVQLEKYSDDLLNGVCTWGDVGDSERIVDDLQDLHDRLTGTGEYQ